MKIIISPAKKMVEDTDSLQWERLPGFLEKTALLKSYIQSLNFGEAKALWQCNDKIALQNFERFKDMTLDRRLTPALLAYDGIQYQSMAPKIFTGRAWDYADKNLRILSGFYGVLAPLDGVVPYRLEMQAKVKNGGFNNLYEFWGDSLYRQLATGENCIVNLASKEYSKCIESYLLKDRKKNVRRFPEFKFVTCVFQEKNKAGKFVQKATQAKIARGEMVRFMAENEITNIEDLKNFAALGYKFAEEASEDEKFVFIKAAEK